MHSYEAFLTREMPEFIQSQNPLLMIAEPFNHPKTKERVYKYRVEIYVGGLDGKGIYASAPTLNQGNTIRRLFPNDARLWNITYAIQFSMDLFVRYIITTIDGYDVKTNVSEVTFPKHSLFTIPILVKSRFCATYGATPALLMEMGECKNEHGAYFIIDGKEKILITHQESAFNTLIVTKKPASDPKLKILSSVDCQHPITKMTRRVAIYLLKGSDTESHLENVIRVSIPQVNGAFPLFILFRALGVESDEEIIRMILPDPTAPGAEQMEQFLHESIMDAYPVVNQVLAVQFIRTLTKGFIEETVLYLLNEHVFSHIKNLPYAKAYYLAECVRQVLQVQMGIKESTDRDNIINQRLYSPGMLLRGLFTGVWRAWKKDVQTTLEGTYRYNPSLYQNEQFRDIVNAGTLQKLFHPRDGMDLQKGLMKGFRGSWGTTSYDEKPGVLQAVERISYFNVLSHGRRVASEFDTTMKSRGPRKLHPSQIGFFCLAEGPTGAPVGITKNFAVLTTISLAANPDPILNWLYTKGGVIKVADASLDIRANPLTVSVQLNGGTIGFTQDAINLILVLKYMKWTACLTPMASISFETAERILRIYVDDGRPLRPLWHLGAGVGQEKWPAVVKTGKALPPWRDLVVGTFPATSYVRGVESIPFLDPFADRESVPLKEYLTLLAPYIGCIEYIDLFESNEAYISWYGESNHQLEREHTHAEIHPSVIAGIIVNTLPFANHNQANRWQWASGQSKQGIGYYSTNFDKRFDTYGSIACVAETPIVRTLYYDALGGGTMPYGMNIVLALAVVDGYNQEDSEILNRSSVERGMFHSLALRSYELMEEIDDAVKTETRFANPDYVKAWTNIQTGYNYSNLDERGIIKVGTELDNKTVLVGRYMLNRKTNEYTDASITNKIFTKGRVDRVELLQQPNGLRIVKLRILEVRIPELGDKFATRHHQKGTVGMLMDACDMPRTASGIVPDMIMNPHGVPTRMTVAQFYEQIYCKYGAISGTKINATNFMDQQDTLETLGDLLEKEGFERHGEEVMYSGVSGLQLEGSVFIGPCYLMRLKHLTEDKINSRGKGKKVMLTHQPTGGRGNEGGMRIGEMERDILIAHGTSQFMQESYMGRSDGTTLWICNGCGTIPIYNERLKLFVCPLCDGPLKFSGDSESTLELLLPITKSRVGFSRVAVPYAYKLFDQEITNYANISMRIITEKHARVFQSLDDVDLEESLEEPPTLINSVTNTVTDLVKTGVEAVQSLVAPVVAPVEAPMGEATSSEELAINKANAVLEAPIPPPVAPESTGTTIVIEQGSSPVKVESVVEEAAPAEQAEQAAPAEQAEQAAQAAPAEQAAPAGGPAPLLLQPQAGGAPVPPRKKISWKGVEQAPPASEEHVTVLKIG